MLTSYFAPPFAHLPQIEANGTFSLRRVLQRHVVTISNSIQGVLDIFYDVLSLEFIQKLDDAGFFLAKMDILGKRLYRVTNSVDYRTELPKTKAGIRTRWFLKAVYFINSTLILAGLIVVTFRQLNGHYYEDKVLVRFGGEIWDDALVLQRGAADFDSQAPSTPTSAVCTGKSKERHTTATRSTENRRNTG